MSCDSTNDLYSLAPPHFFWVISMPRLTVVIGTCFYNSFLEISLAPSYLFLVLLLMILSVQWWKGGLIGDWTLSLSKWFPIFWPYNCEWLCNFTQISFPELGISSVKKCVVDSLTQKSLQVSFLVLYSGDNYAHFIVVGIKWLRK